MEKSVSMLTPITAATALQLSICKAACVNISLPQKPESGGIPTSEKAEMANSTATNGNFL